MGRFNSVLGKEMKYITLLCLAACLLSQEQISILPILGVKFGDIAVIEFTAVSKANDYYSQNIVHANFMLSITSINGVRIDPSIRAVPLVYGDEKYEIGKNYKVRAYEKIESVAAPRRWNKGVEPAQFDYSIRQSIVIKLVD